MTRSSSSIALPEWYVRIAEAGPEDGTTLGTAPFTIYGPAADLDVAASDAPAGAAIFHGYLVDRAASARELGCDSEASCAAVLLAAFRRWGEDAFHHVDGCFMAAVWDARTGRVLIGHDGLGHHPVFYAAVGDTLWFSANVLTLPAHGVVPARANRVSLALLGLRYWPEAGETFFEGVRRLRPGHVLSWANAGAQTREEKRWDPLPDEDEPWLPESQVLEEFEPRLTRAVERCLQLAPEGIMLSGGVDSVTIAALAMNAIRHRGLPPLTAVSGRLGRGSSYEEVMQSRVTAALGMPHVISTTSEWRAGRDHIELSLDLTPELPSPGTVYWVGTYTAFYRHTARAGLHVLLTGSGGDNWLSVGDAYAADLLARGRLKALVDFVASDLTTGGAVLSRVVYRRVWAFGVRPHLDTLWARLAPSSKTRYHRQHWESRLPVWLAPDPALRAELVDRLLMRRTPALARNGKAPRSYYRHALRSYANPYMHHENETAFHVDALCGLRLLSPYHDRQLVSFFNRISPATLVHGRRYKGLLRPTLARHLPNLGLERQAKRYDRTEFTREIEAVRSSLSRVWPDYNFERLRRLGVVEEEALSRHALGIGRLPLGEMAILYGMLSAERWLKARAQA